MAGRLEGTHTFLRDDLPQMRARSTLLDEVNIAAQQSAQALAQGVKAPEVIKPAGGKSDPGPYRQIHVGCAGSVATHRRSEQCQRLDPACPQLRFMPAQVSPAIRNGIGSDHS